jgi:hypothetical protein
MRYTKPTILTTMAASAAIQSGANQEAKVQPLKHDSDQSNPIRSTSGAYEADE